MRGKIAMKNTAIPTLFLGIIIILYYMNKKTIKKIF